jgi:hypothetical protein
MAAPPGAAAIAAGIAAGAGFAAAYGPALAALNGNVNANAAVRFARVAGHAHDAQGTGSRR